MNTPGDTCTHRQSIGCDNFQQKEETFELSRGLYMRTGGLQDKTFLNLVNRNGSMPAGESMV